MAFPLKRRWKENRSHLKNIFCLDIFVGAPFQIFDPPQADLWFATHKENLGRRQFALSGKTLPRGDLDLRRLLIERI